MQRFEFALVITFLCFAISASLAQTSRDFTPVEAVQAINKVQTSEYSFQLVQTLTERFGSRLTGSEQEHQAAAWAVGQMKRAGLNNVHLENWTIHHGWKRVHAYARLTEPFDSKLDVASYGWSGSTPGAVSGEIVLFDGNAAPTEASTRDWTGKVVLVAPPSKDGIRGVADAPLLAEWAKKAHALAVIEGIVRPGAILHTGPLGYPGHETSVPVLDMPEAQQHELEQLVKQGARPKIRLDIATRFSNGPVKAENVVGEIRGSEHPEEVVLLGAHLDSWDLGPGATDDGTGVAAVIAAAHLIQNAGVRPRRTIRFVLFTGEEQGLLGSHAYVERHRAELSNFACALVLDWGAGPVNRFLLAGHTELKEPLQALFQSVDTLRNLEVAPGFLTFTDGFSFTFAGLPGIGLVQDSPNYDRDAHSSQDSLQAVDGAALRFNTKVLAEAAIWLANVKPKPGIAFTRTENEQSLRPVAGALQMLGMWPHPRNDDSTQTRRGH